MAKERCKICGKRVRVMCQKGTGACNARHLEALLIMREEEQNEEHEPAR